jgi:hypothetical protein
MTSIKIIAHGPALTLKIETTNLSTVIDVDVVPVFDFKYEVLTDSNISYDLGSKFNIRRSDTFFLVPKQKRNVLDGDQVSISSKFYSKLYEQSSQKCKQILKTYRAFMLL